MTQIKTLPPYAQPPFIENLVIDSSKKGSSYHYSPQNWYAADSNVPFNTQPDEHFNENPHGSEFTELLNQSEDGDYIRMFYPDVEALWDHNTDTLGTISYDALLKEADYQHTLGKKILLAGQWFTPHANVLGVNVRDQTYETRLNTAIVGLLSSTRTNAGGLGYTLANHPGIASFEPGNEQIDNVTSNNGYAEAYAIMSRVLYRNVKFYTNWDYVTFTVVGSNAIALGIMLHASAATGNSLSVQGDDGVGKVMADYIDKRSWHFYQIGTETEDSFKDQRKTNALCSKSNLFNVYSNYYATMWYACNVLTTSPLFGTDPFADGLQNTESGINATEKSEVYEGGSRVFTKNEDESLETILQWKLPVFGILGHAGVNYEYKSDIPGLFYGPGKFGTGGDIIEVSGSLKGEILITVNFAPPKGWLDNMRMVITASTGGWSDLGLSVGEKKRFAITKTNKENVLVLNGTTFTAAPTANSTSYSEYQLSHTNYKETLDAFNAIVNAPVTMGWIIYPKEEFRAYYFIVEEKCYYFNQSGKLLRWY